VTQSITPIEESIMYVSPNCKTKAELKRRLAAGETVEVFSPGPFPAPTDGRVSLEGPHYPKPHTWYASGTMEGGKLVKVS
jgi:hypothetical protein